MTSFGEIFGWMGAAVAGRSRSMVNVIGQLPTGVVAKSIRCGRVPVNRAWVSLGLWNGAFHRPSSWSVPPADP
jgi:hypothetical protein